MILSLFNSGVTEMETIAAVSGRKPSYVGSVLHKRDWWTTISTSIPRRAIR